MAKTCFVGWPDQIAQNSDVNMRNKYVYNQTQYIIVWPDQIAKSKQQQKQKTTLAVAI